MLQDFTELTVIGQVADPFETFEWRTPPLGPNPGLVFLLRTG